MRELSEEDFDTETGNGFSLIDFTARWCAPCEVLAPVIERLAQDYLGKMNVYRVDVDAARTLAARHGVMSVPTLVLFRDGKAVARRIGSIEEGDLRTMIEGEMA